MIIIKIKMFIDSLQQMKLLPYIDAQLKYFNFVDDDNTTKNDDKKKLYY